MIRVDAVLFRPLVRRTAAAATVAAVLLATFAPSTLFVQTRRAEQVRATAAALRAAELARTLVGELPDLWYYASPKHASHLHLLAADPSIARLAVLDSAGRRLDVPSGPVDGLWPPILWGRAPVHRGAEAAAEVWVGLDVTRPLLRVLAMLLTSVLLSAALSTALYVLPVLMVRRAQGRIEGLVEKLERASADLAKLNSELEARVERRSRQLAETAKALRTSEALLRKIAGRAAEAEEQERTRVARDLHDGAGQVLTAIRIDLEVLGASLEPDSASHRRLAGTERLVDEAIEELRRIAVALRPAPLDRLLLVESLEELARAMASRSGLEVSFEADPVPGSLPAVVESSAYRIVQEGLTNVVRHADARRVEVRVSFDGTRLGLEVRDDGRGFELDGAHAGLGLENMKERMTLIGGDLAVESAPGCGSVLRATIPVFGGVADEGEAGEGEA